MNATLCLLCGRRRHDTVCGDQSCPCVGGHPWADVGPVIVTGLGYRTPRGMMVTAPCGRAIPEAAWVRMMEFQAERSDRRSVVIGASVQDGDS